MNRSMMFGSGVLLEQTALIILKSCNLQADIKLCPCLEGCGVRDENFFCHSSLEIRVGIDFQVEVYVEYNGLYKSLNLNFCSLAICQYSLNRSVQNLYHRKSL